MYMVDKGVEFTHFTVKNWFYCGKKEILLETNEMLLKHLFSRNNKAFPIQLLSLLLILDKTVLYQTQL